MKYISVPIFMASLIIGLFFVYMIGSDMKTVYVYPTPENTGQIQYTDKSDNCFIYNAHEQPCPANASEISSIPIQN
jgi:hypothetical protein